MSGPVLVNLLNDFVAGLMAYTQDLDDERRQFVWGTIIAPEIDSPQEAECKLSVRLKSEACLPPTQQRVAYAFAQVIEDEELTFTVRCLGFERQLPLFRESRTQVYEAVTRQLKKELTSQLPQ
jgi:hypothetical protein